MPTYDDSDFGHAPTSPTHPRKMSSITGSNGNSLPIPGAPNGADNGPIEIPATKSSISEAYKYMHELSSPLL